MPTQYYIERIAYGYIGLTTEVGVGYLSSVNVYMDAKATVSIDDKTLNRTSPIEPEEDGSYHFSFGADAFSVVPKQNKVEIFKSGKPRPDIANLLQLKGVSLSDVDGDGDADILIQGALQTIILYNPKKSPTAQAGDLKERWSCWAKSLNYWLDTKNGTGLEFVFYGTAKNLDFYAFQFLHTHCPSNQVLATAMAASPVVDASFRLESISTVKDFGERDKLYFSFVKDDKIEANSRYYAASVIENTIMREEALLFLANSPTVDAAMRINAANGLENPEKKRDTLLSLAQNSKISESTRLFAASGLTDLKTRDKTYFSIVKSGGSAVSAYSITNLEMKDGAFLFLAKDITRSPEERINAARLIDNIGRKLEALGFISQNCNPCTDDDRAAVKDMLNKATLSD